MGVILLGHLLPPPCCFQVAPYQTEICKASCSFAQVRLPGVEKLVDALAGGCAGPRCPSLDSKASEGAVGCIPDTSRPHWHSGVPCIIDFKRVKAWSISCHLREGGSEQRCSGDSRTSRLPVSAVDPRHSSSRALELRGEWQEKCLANCKARTSIC